jgi:hypothetical protein
VDDELVPGGLYRSTRGKTLVKVIEVYTNWWGSDTVKGEIVESPVPRDRSKVIDWTLFGFKANYRREQ